MTYAPLKPHIKLQVYTLVQNDILRAKSRADLDGRLAEKGFAIRNESQGQVIVTLPHGVVIGPVSPIAVPV